MSSWWPRAGQARGRGRNREIYWRGEWISARGEDAQVRGDQVVTRTAANPDYRRALRAARRRAAR